MYPPIILALGMAVAASARSVLFNVSEDFNLQAYVGATTVPTFTFAASDNGTQEQLFLYRPTKDFLAVAYTNTTADGTALNLRYGGETWGLTIYNFGQGSNRKTTVSAQKGSQDFNWFVSADDGQISHRLSQAAEHLLVCSDQINFLSTVVLSSGTQALNGSEPYGCEAARLYKRALA